MIGKSFNDGWTYRKVNPNEQSHAAGKKESISVTLPHDATIAEKRCKDALSGSQKGYWPDGTYEYCKLFQVPEDFADRKIVFQFEGVYRDAMVFINGCYAGQNSNGYTDFSVSANHLLKYGVDNEIKVTVKTGKDSRWYAGAGIYRNVKMYVGKPVHISLDGVRLTTGACDEAVASVIAEIEVENDDIRKHQLAVNIEMLDTDGTVVCKDSQKLSIAGRTAETISPRLYVKNPKLWNVDTPDLYRVKVTISEGEEVLDEAIIPGYGIRVLSLDNVRGLTINGKTVKLYGGCIHHDNGVIGAATIERAEERRVQLLRRAGYNAIRSAHHPISKALLDACDRHGMLVMDEFTDMWNTAKNPDDYSSNFETSWKQDVERMVRKDYNHPCVIMYSCGNEINEAGNSAGAAIMRRISSEIRRLDPTRYTTAGINSLLACMGMLQEIMQAQMAGQGTSSEASAAQDVNSASGANSEKTDAQGANPASGEINATMADMGAQMKAIQAMPPIVEATNEAYEALDVAGYNYAESRYEYDRNLYDNWISVGSETFPKDLAANWKLCLENPDVVGDFSWTSWDYLGEAGIGKYTFEGKSVNAEGIYAPYPYRLAYDADFDITGEETPQGYYREIVIENRKAPYIAVQDPEFYDKKPVISSWSWTSHVSSWTWKGYEGKPIRVEVYSKADEAELFVNGSSVGRQEVLKITKSDRELAFFNVFDTTYEPGKVEVVTYTNGIEADRYELLTADEELQICMNADRTEIKTDGTDLTYIDIYLKDSKGIVNPNSDRKVSVSIQGAGMIQGMGTGNPLSEEDFNDDTCTTFYGHLLAVVRPTEQGEISVTASAEGCKEASITIQSSIADE